MIKRTINVRRKETLQHCHLRTRRHWGVVFREEKMGNRLQALGGIYNWYIIGYSRPFRNTSPTDFVSLGRLYPFLTEYQDENRIGRILQLQRAEQWTLNIMSNVKAGAVELDPPD